MDDALKRYQEKQIDRYNLLRQMCQKIAEWNPECTKVQFEYSGYGDEMGDFVPSMAFGEDWEYTPEQCTELSRITDAYEQVLWEFAQQAGADENNDGCNGIIVIDIVAGTMDVENNAVITDYHTTSESHNF